MAISFHPNISNTLIGLGVLGGGLSASSAFSIYSGTQPSPADILNNWSIYSSGNSNFLAHYSGAVWSQPSFWTNSTASITTMPTASNTVRSGVGTWAILWSANVLLADVNSGAIPTTSFIVVPVSTLTGIGTIRFDATTTFVAGTQRQIADGVFSSSAA